MQWIAEGRLRCTLWLIVAMQRADSCEQVALVCLPAGAPSTVLPDRSGKTPLHLGAEHSTVAVMQAHLTAALSHTSAEDLAAALDKKQRTVLHYAARNPDGSMVEVVVKHMHSAAFAGCVDVNGELPVHHAARFSSAGGITACLASGDATLQLLTPDKSGRLALHYAASAPGTYKRKGKDANAEEDTAPESAASACLAVELETACAQVLYADAQDKLPSFYAARLEGGAVLAALLAVGDTAEAQLKHVDEEGRCLAHYAAQRRTPATLRACLEAAPDGGDVTRQLQTKDRHGKLPSEYAVADAVRAMARGDVGNAQAGDAGTASLDFLQPALEIIEAAIPRQPISEKSDRGVVLATFLAATFGADALRRGAGVLDVAGGKGELARALAAQGIPAVTVDPYCSPELEAAAQQDSVTANGWPRQLREPFNWRFGESHADLLDAASCLVGLHPDQPTGAIVEVALAQGKPFAVVPCCVFASQFPERRLAKSGKLVRQTEELVAWLCEQAEAEGRRPQVVTLPMRGRNSVVFCA